LTCVRHGPPVTVHSAKPSFENPSRVSRHPGNDIRPTAVDTRFWKDWLQPQRSAARTVAVRRFETPAGKQAQVDWGHLGTLESEGERKLWAFTFTLGYSRRMMAEAALDQKLGTLLRLHEEAFR